MARTSVILIFDALLPKFHSALRCDDIFIVFNGVKYCNKATAEFARHEVKSINRIRLAAAIRSRLDYCDREDLSRGKRLHHSRHKTTPTLIIGDELRKVSDMRTGKTKFSSVFLNLLREFLDRSSFEKLWNMCRGLLSVYFLFLPRNNSRVEHLAVVE